MPGLRELSSNEPAPRADRSIEEKHAVIGRRDIGPMRAEVIKSAGTYDMPAGHWERERASPVAVVDEQ